MPPRSTTYTPRSRFVVTGASIRITSYPTVLAADYCIGESLGLPGPQTSATPTTPTRSREPLFRAVRCNGGVKFELASREVWSAGLALQLASRLLPSNDEVSRAEGLLGRDDPLVEDSIG
jgi:hypothetical protein